MTVEEKMRALYAQLTGEEKDNVTAGELCQAIAESAGRVATLVSAMDSLNPKRSAVQAREV